MAIAAFALLLLPATPASANGAMGLVLGTFWWDLWAVYVVATLLFEALALGRWLRVPFRRAVLLSVGANLLTALVGGCLSGPLSYGFLGVFGSRLNPNPLGQSLLLLALFGLVSAPVEAWVWQSFVRDTLPRSRVFALSAAVHLLGVPLALAILLLPSRPYPGLEMQAGSQRHSWLQHEVLGALTEHIQRHGALPSGDSYGEVLEQIRPQLGRYARDPGLWAAAYRPNYHRFDTGEMRRTPIEWNTSAETEKLLQGPRRTVWLYRWCSEDYCQGLVMQLPEGSVTRTTDRKKLGLRNAEKD